MDESFDRNDFAQWRSIFQTISSAFRHDGQFGLLSVAKHDDFGWFANLYCVEGNHVVIDVPHGDSCELHDNVAAF